MNAYLFWDGLVRKPEIGSVLLNYAPHVHFQEGSSNTNRSLQEITREKPELIFVALSGARADHRALLREIRRRVPESYLISMGEAPKDSSAENSEINLFLPLPCSDKQLLDAVFQAELFLNRIEPEENPEEEEQNLLMDPSVFLTQLDDVLFQNPEELCRSHWEQLEVRMKQIPEGVGLHIVSLSGLMMDRLSGDSGCPPEFSKIHAETLKTVSKGQPSVSIWKEAFRNLCSSYVQLKQNTLDTTDREILRIKQYVNDHIEGDVTLKQVAQKFYLSTSYLSRLFKSKTGTNYSDYISEKKVERAKALLSETDLTILEISQRLNYPEQNSFSRFFKSRVGMSPQAFRKMTSRKAGNRPSPTEDIIEEFEITDFGPCAFITEDTNSAYAFHKRI